MKKRTEDLLFKWGLRLIGLVFFMLVYLLLFLSSCSTRIITKSKSDSTSIKTVFKDSTITKSDTMTLLKGDSVIVYIRDTIVNYKTETKLIEKVITIKEECKTKQEVRQENRTKRDSMRYIYKTIRDTVRINGSVEKQSNRQKGRTDRNIYFWLLIASLSFLFGYNFNYLFNVKTKK